MLRKLIINFFIFHFLFIFTLPVNSENIVNATRVWPALDYTRVTIESALPISNDQMMLQNPERIDDTRVETQHE